MRNADVVNNFIDGIDDCKGSNLYSESGELINYTTLIALRHQTGLILNGDDYSSTTKVHQNRIRRSGVNYIETTEKGIYELRDNGHTDEPQVLSVNEKPLEDKGLNTPQETEELEMIKSIELLSLRMVRESSIEYKYGDTNVSNPRNVVDIAEKMFNISELPEEVFAMLCLDTKNKVSGAFIVSQGSINASIVHPREVFKRAMLCNANSIILVHNHPSGVTEPSKEDITTTERLVDSGKILGIKILDHIIIGGNLYTSFKEEGLM